MIKLRVRVIKARGLPPTSFDGTCDSYCVITLQHGGLESTDRTAVVSGSVSPEWEHKAVFKDVAGATGLRIACRSKEDEPLGIIQLPASLLRDQPAGKAKWKAEWRALQLEPGMKAVAGELYASVTIQPADGSERGATQAVGAVSERRSSTARSGRNRGAGAGGAGAPPNKLVVEIVEARGLLAEDFNVMSADSSDPYCVLRCMGKSYRTKVVDASLEPAWNERAEFVVADADTELELTVLDQDVVGSDDFLGQLRVQLSDTRVQRPASGTPTGSRPEWFQLLDQDMGGGGQRGEVLLALDWVRDEDAQITQQAERQALEASGAAPPAAAAASASDTGGGIFASMAVGSAIVGGGGGGQQQSAEYVSAGALLGSGAKGSFEERRRARAKIGCGSKRSKAGGSKSPAPAGEGSPALARGGRGGKRGKRGKDSKARMTPEERAQQKEAALKEQLRLKAVNASLVRGDYEVRVHLIEVRGLKGEDLSGLSDPVIEVQLLPDSLRTAAGTNTQSSSIKHAVCDAVYDEMLFFTLKDVGRDELRSCSVKVSVLDSDTLGRNDLIGVYALDLLGIYFRDDHELYRQWVALVDPLNDEDRGTQGYLLMSVVVLGPGDTPKTHDAAAEHAQQLADSKSRGMAMTDFGSSLCLMPPTVKQHLSFLVISVYCADGLPAMDTNVLGKPSIDAFVQVEFGGNPAVRTTVVTEAGDANIVCVWEEELWIPVMVPTMSDVITLSVWDEDTFSDELVGSVTRFSFSEAAAGAVAPVWAHIYGPHDDAAECDEAQTMRRYPAKATAWCGRLLAGVRVASGDDIPRAKARDAAVHTQDLASELPAARWPQTRLYTLRAFLLSGAELPELGISSTSTLGDIGSSLGISTTRMHVRVSVGPFDLSFPDAEVTDGQAHWGSVLERTAIELPADLEQVPDVFIYLCTATGKPCCFARVPAAQLFAEGMQGETHWVPLDVDPSVSGTSGLAASAASARQSVESSKQASGAAAGSAGASPGTLLLKLGFCSDETAEQASWDSEVQAQHQWAPAQVRCHIYQARNLPAADDDGTIDPFVVCRIGGKVQKTSYYADTHNPLFYETLCFDLMLRERLELAPELVLQVWDDDGQWNDDELAGQMRLSLKNATRHASARAADLALFTGDGKKKRGVTVPRWYQLQAPGSHAGLVGGAGARAGGGTDRGEVLVALQVLMLGDGEKLTTPPSLWPKTRRARVDVFALGVRAMQPYLFMPINMPYVQFELQQYRSGAEGEEAAAVSDGETRGGAVAWHQRTATSQTPSGPEANFLETVSFDCELPVDPLFAPHLGVKVFDSRLGGFTTPLVGSSSIALETKLPWNKAGYVAPQKHYFKPAAPPKKGGVLGEGGGSEPRDLAKEKLEQEESAKKRKKKARARRRAARAADDKCEDRDEPEDEMKTSSSKGRVSLVREPDWAARASASAGEGEDASAGSDQGAGADAGAGVPKPGGNLWAPHEFVDGREWWVNSSGSGAELEDFLLTTPFESYKLSLGQGPDGLVQAGHRTVGLFKGIVRVTPHRERDVAEKFPATSAQPCVVRAYVLRAFNLQKMDDDGLSDPYAVLRLGSEVQSDRQHFIEDSTDPDIFRCFQFCTQLPGASQLEVELWDMDRFSPDDLIGKTVIDLEDRFFHKQWREVGRTHPAAARHGPIKPLETRSLWSEGSASAQGQVQLWVDILTPQEAKRFKPIPIAPPAPEKFEVQMVLWKSRDVHAMDAGNMNDLYARAFMEGCTYQESDTHWRCYAGKGSWNWRFKFEVELPMKT
eukprot:g5539.t1